MSVAVDGDDNVFVADWGNNLVKQFDKDGVFQKQWGRSYNGPDFTNPYGVALTNDGRFVVTSVGTHKVIVVPLAEGLIELWGEAGPGDGEFETLLGVAVDSRGKVFVANQRQAVGDSPEIQVFRSVGAPNNFIARWGIRGSDPGRFNSVSGVAVDAENSVYVADPSDGRIQRFTGSGRFTGTAGGSLSDSNPFVRPQGIAVAPDGTTYVVDSGKHSVLVFRQGPV
jgi:DNA-binding beta-propeller fold protein YncE